MSEAPGSSETCGSHWRRPAGHTAVPDDFLKCTVFSGSDGDRSVCAHRSLNTVTTSFACLGLPQSMPGLQALHQALNPGNQNGWTKGPCLPSKSFIWERKNGRESDSDSVLWTVIAWCAKHWESLALSVSGCGCAFSLAQPTMASCTHPIPISASHTSCTSNLKVRSSTSEWGPQHPLTPVLRLPQVALLPSPTLIPTLRRVLCLSRV